MLIIWSGFGFVPVVLFVVLSIFFGADQTGSPTHDRGLAYALLVTGVVTGALGWWLQQRPGRVVIDKATGRELVLRKRHALFFIPMVYWGLIFIAMGLYEWFTMKH